MGCQRVCPFYGQSIDHCDVGAGYISPYHVEVIVRHCTSRYKGCAKYQKLTERGLHQGKATSAPLPQRNSHSVPMPSGGLLLPLPLDKEVVTLVSHEIRTPLTSIRSFTEILLDYPIDDPEARRRFLQIIHTEAKRLSHAVDVLFGKAESSTCAPAKLEPSSGNPPTPEVTTHVETLT